MARRRPDLVDPMAALLERWSEDEQILRHRGADGGAAALAKCRQEVEEAWRQYWAQTLTLSEAAAESGENYNSLQKSVNNGRIRNAGKARRPLITRRDLMKRRGTAEQGVEVPDLASRLLQS